MDLRLDLRETLAITGGPQRENEVQRTEKCPEFTAGKRTLLGWSYLGGTILNVNIRCK
jgi:hypothetical protein